MRSNGRQFTQLRNRSVDRLHEAFDSRSREPYHNLNNRNNRPNQHMHFSAGNHLSTANLRGQRFTQILNRRNPGAYLVDDNSMLNSNLNNNNGLNNLNPPFRNSRCPYAYMHQPSSYFTPYPQIPSFVQWIPVNQPPINQPLVVQNPIDLSTTGNRRQNVSPTNLQRNLLIQSSSQPQHQPQHQHHQPQHQHHQPQHQHQPQPQQTPLVQINLISNNTAHINQVSYPTTNQPPQQLPAQHPSLTIQHLPIQNQSSSQARSPTHSRPPTNVTDQRPANVVYHQMNNNSSPRNPLLLPPPMSNQFYPFINSNLHQNNFRRQLVPPFNMVCFILLILFKIVH